MLGGHWGTLQRDEMVPIKFRLCSFCESPKLLSGSCPRVRKTLFSAVSFPGRNDRGKGGNTTISFPRLLCCRKLPVTARHVPLVYWPGTFLLRTSFVFSGCNLCYTWSSDNVDDPVFDEQSSLSRYCCPSLGPSPILVQRRKKKIKEQWRQI